MERSLLCHCALSYHSTIHGISETRNQGPPAYVCFLHYLWGHIPQFYILLQNCHCLATSLKVADANNINILKKSWRAATGIKEARGEDGLLNQLHIQMFPSLIQHTNRDHSQHLPPAAAMVWIWPGAIQKPCVVSEAMHQYLLCPAIRAANNGSWRFHNHGEGPY